RNPPARSTPVAPLPRAATRVPAPAAVQARLDRKWCHLASCRRWFMPAFWLAPCPSVQVVAAVRIRLGHGTAAQVGRLDRLHSEHSVRAHQGKRCLVLPRARLGGFRASLAPLLATADPLLCLLQRLLGGAVVPRVGAGVPRGGEQEH